MLRLSGLWRKSAAAVPLLVLAGVLVLAYPAHAIPAFARTYGTSCSTCHVDFPKLNDFGKAFKDAGFKFPKDDEAMVKAPPVMLGAPAQAELWPHSIWPGKIPGMPPIGLRMNSFFQVLGKKANNAQFVPNGATAATLPNLAPRTDFEAGVFSIFTAGNLGSDIAFWVDEDFSVGGSNSAGGLGDGYLKFHDLSRMLRLPKDSLNLRVGQFELDLPFSPARSINLSSWDIFDQANSALANPVVSGAFPQLNTNSVTLSTPADGVEISGGHHYGGYWYSLAVFDQNTSGTNPSAQLVPSANGEDFASDSNFKDLYGRFMYRFNLERNGESRRAVQAASDMGPRDHTYLSLGSFYMYGRGVQRVVGVLPASTDTNTVLTARDPFYRVGGDFSFNYRKFNLFGVYMYGRDHTVLPVDATGAVSATPVALVNGGPATFGGGFLQADYLMYPWMMLIMRYDGVNSVADFRNGLAAGAGPASATRNRFTPGVQFLIHANIKASFEYAVRPQQQLTAGIDPVTLAPVGLPTYRTNTATAGLEFVF